MPRSIVASIGVLLLAACASKPAPEPPLPLPPPPPPLAHAAPHRAAGRPVVVAVRPAPVPEVQAEPLAAPLPPFTAIGLSQHALQDQLGAPAQKESHGAGWIWTYRGPACSVSVSFYYDVTRGDFFALSQRTAEPSGADAARCLAEIRSAHAS